MIEFSQTPIFRFFKYKNYIISIMWYKKIQTRAIPITIKAAAKNRNNK